ncbi:MAG TPA: disulfide bond formation protein B [Gaiellaceae bacterium]|jgi:disulfide bond formation protein DsbB
MTHAVTVGLAALGVVGQVLLGLLLVLGLLALFGASKPLARFRSLVWGYELWLAFLVAGTATAGSLFFSEVAHFVPCELCWFQRIFMYPLALLTFLAALADDHRIARYLLPLPVIGAGFSAYHLLVENGVVRESQGCQLSAPGGCAVRWVDEFGYVTIPTLALTAFGLVFSFLLLAVFDPRLPSERE